MVNGCGADVRHQRSRGRRQAAPLAEHVDRRAGRRARRRTLPPGTLGYEWDFDPTTASARRARRLSRHGRRSTACSGLRHDRRRRNATHNMTLYRARQRRARVRRRHRAVVAGAWTPTIGRAVPGRGQPIRDAAGDRQPVRRHGHPAHDAAGRPRRLRPSQPTRLPRHRSSRRPPTGRASLPARRSRSAEPPPMSVDGSEQSRFLSTVERPGTEPQVARPGRTPGRRRRRAR